MSAHPQLNGDKPPDEQFMLNNAATKEAKPLRNAADEELLALRANATQMEAQFHAQARFHAQIIAVITFELERRQKTFGLIVPR